MSERFITFMPVTGIFEQAIKPYKKWYELADMSPWIEVDGEHYRILRTTGRIDKFSTRKMVMCDESGELVKDKKISQECYKVQAYLNNFQLNSDGMIAGSKDNIDYQLDEFITELKHLMNKISSQILGEDKQALEFHLYYYEEVKRYSKIIMNKARELQTYIQPLQENEIEVLTTTLVEHLKSNLTEWEVTKGYVEALMIEVGNKSKKTVRKILRSSEYQDYIQDKKIAERMINETYEAERAVIRLLADGKSGWKREVKWLHPNKGSFNVEQYIDDLWNRNIVDVFTEVNTNEFTEEYWLFS